MKIEEILNKGNAEQVYKDNKYFPLGLIIGDETPLQFILGVRGDGKTYNAKKQIHKDWYEDGIKSYWVVPTKTEMDEMIATKDFHLDLLLPEWPSQTDTEETKEEMMEIIREKYNESDILAHGYAERTRMDREFLYDDNGEWFCRMIPLSMYQKYKKGAHPKVHRIYYDEFMRESYLKNESFKIQDLITSVQREKTEFKVIFMGNAISLEHPLFIDLDIFQLDDDVVTVINDIHDIPLAKVTRWKRPPEDSEKKNGELLWYRLAKKTGYAKYAIDNEFKNDRLDNIIRLSDEDMKHLMLMHTVEIESMYVDIYMIPANKNSTGKRLYYCKVNKNDNARSQVKIALDNDYATDNIIHQPDIASSIARRIQSNMFWYDSVAVKKALQRCVRNKM